MLLSSADWFKECNGVLERYQQEVVQQETDKWNKDRQSYLEELKEDLEEIKKKNCGSSEAFLRHIYQKHPPKRKELKLGKIPDVESDTYWNDMKALLRNAIIHYHPDKIDIEKHGNAWKVLCEEISKYLSSKYETFKMMKPRNERSRSK